MKRRQWTTAADLKGELARRWDRGEFLRPLVVGRGGQFPLRLRLRGPSAADLTAHFEDVRRWATSLAATPRIRIEWREVGHRVMGQQRLPQSVWIDSLDDALALIVRRDDAAHFTRVLDLTRRVRPELLEWLERYPLQAVDQADVWPQLLDVVAWIESRPRPGVYLRQVDIPGIDSKFIEGHRSVLAPLLDLVLPSGAVAHDCKGVTRFAARYGFLGKPIHIRLRPLDEGIGLLPGPVLPDLSLDAESFARLDLPVRRAIITENETNFLALPPVPGAIAIFGAGYGWEALARAKWLQRCTVHYWGDIDTHGFAILDRLRCHLPDAESFLMDRGTLDAHEAHWGEEHNQVTDDLPRLTGEESALYDALRDNRIRGNLRLEQERIGFRMVRDALDNIVRQAAGPAARADP